MSSVETPPTPGAPPEVPGDAAPLSRRAVVRAVLAVLWLLTCAVAAIPDFGRASADANWNDPRVVDELGAWAKVLGQEQKAFVATLKSIASTGGDIREALLTPFRPILSLTGMRQSWVVFIAGTRQADRFEVHAIHDDGRVQRLYLRGDDSAQWQARLIEGSRFRNATFFGAWPDKRGKRHRQSVCKILAARAFADDDSIDAITCAFLRRKNVKPGEGPVPTEKRIFNTTIRRATLGSQDTP